MKPEWGEIVKYKGRYVRKYDSKDIARWHLVAGKIRKGIFLGYRTVRIGRYRPGFSAGGYPDYDPGEPATFEVIGTLRVALVSPSRKANPIYTELVE